MDTRIIRISGILLSSALVITGCGGGGGGGGSSSTVTPPPDTPPPVIDPATPVAIDTTNAIAITSAVLRGGNTADAYSTMNPYVKAGVTPSSSQTLSYQRIFDLALNKALDTLNNSNTTAQAPVTTNVYNCTNSGTATSVWNDANNNLYEDAGDSFTTTYDQCSETVGTDTSVENGTFTFTLNTETGDPSLPGTSWSVGMSFAMNATFTFSSAGGASGTSALTGGATLNAAYDHLTTIRNGSMSGTSLKDTWTWTDTTGSYSGIFELADFNFAATTKASDTSYTSDIDYTLRADEIGGSVTVSTNPVFTGLGANAPTSGTMVITGANGSTITLVANSDGTSANITVNSDPALTVTWVSLGGW